MNVDLALELAEQKEEWKILFNLCLKYKQWRLLEEYWKKLDEMLEVEE